MAYYWGQSKIIIAIWQRVAHDLNKTIAKPLTVYDAVQHYIAWYKEHRKAYVETNLTINAHILPHFGHQLISNLKSQNIKVWHNQLAIQAPRKRTARALKQQYRAIPEDAAGKRSRKATANRILTVLKAILNKAFPAIGFHELRHTYVSLLAQAGADLLTISKLLGHADTRVTSRHYAHLCDKTLANTVNRLLPSFGHEKEKKVQNIA